MEEKINAWRVTLWKLAKTRPLEKHTRRQENNINRLLQTVNSMGWCKVINMPQDSNKGREFCENSNGPAGYKKFGEFIKKLGNRSLLKKGSAAWSSLFRMCSRYLF